MYSVTKRIDFCYGHRLLDYDGICKHPHGHNAVAEIEVRTDRLDNRNMVCDFSDIKRIVKGWIDRVFANGVAYRYPEVPAWSGFLGDKRGMLVMTSSYEPSSFSDDHAGNSRTSCTRCCTAPSHTPGCRWSIRSSPTPLTRSMRTPAGATWPS